MGTVAHYSLYSGFGVNQVPLHSLVIAQGAGSQVKLPGLMSASFLPDCCTLVTPSPSPALLWKMWPISSRTDGLFVGRREAMLDTLSACHSAYSEGAWVEVCRMHWGEVLQHFFFFSSCCWYLWCLELNPGFCACQATLNIWARVPVLTIKWFKDEVKTSAEHIVFLNVDCM